MGRDRAAFAAVLVGITALAPASGRAIMSGEESKLAPSGDADYAAGKAAFQAEDWPRTVANLTMVVMRRPWHDNAHAMLGYAWRKLGDYDLSLEHYGTALTLNPRHRGALEYLGEAYLELGRVEEASATYRRLAKVCSFIVMGFDNQGWKSGCEELEELTAVFEAHGVPLPGGS